MRRRIVAGNWKMNGTVADLATVAEISTAAKTAACEVVLCLPATLIRSARNLVGMEIGGQDCHARAEGAHTGDISAPMLRNAGAGWVILGHSERRRDHAEIDAQVAAKVLAAWEAGLTVILCIGETEAQYRAGETLGVLAAQIAGSLPEGATPANTMIAYEPVWAIGTGLTPSSDEITRAHAFIRARLPDPALSILYGGSVGPANAAAILALRGVDGALVGGASLASETFIPLIHAMEAAHA
ncbi:triose-phosphate isomerase [Roseovarius autotrophicus]|uniref:triose-phosphate isomerase n=1 Tax=Roseovarius autotrophicus TaxID=2824121 RepID=UPI001B379B14|nr:triose-phosphate isomerase [Roseovarius autotrophicus]